MRCFWNRDDYNYHDLEVTKIWRYLKFDINVNDGKDLDNAEVCRICKISSDANVIVAPGANLGICLGALSSLTILSSLSILRGCHLDKNLR